MCRAHIIQPSEHRTQNTQHTTKNTHRIGSSLSTLNMSGLYDPTAPHSQRFWATEFSLCSSRSCQYNTFTKLHIEKSEKFSAFCPPSATSTLKHVAASKSGTHASLSPLFTRNARSKATGNDPFCVHDSALHTYCSRSWAVADVRAVEVTVVPSCRASRKLYIGREWRLDTRMREGGRKEVSIYISILVYDDRTRMRRR